MMSPNPTTDIALGIGQCAPASLPPSQVEASRTGHRCASIAGHRRPTFVVTLLACLLFCVLTLPMSGCLFFASANDGGQADGVDGGADAGVGRPTDGGDDDAGVPPLDGGRDGGILPPKDGGADDAGIRPLDGGLDGGEVTPFDGGVVDGGDVDGGVDDGGIRPLEDAGIVNPVDGGVLIPWVNPESLFRVRLSISSNEAALAAGDPMRIRFSHESLVEMGANASGAGMVMVHASGADFEPVSNRLAERSSFNEPDTELMIRLVAPIPFGATDDNYFIYFGGTTPSQLVPTVSTARVFSFESSSRANSNDPDNPSEPEFSFAFEAYPQDTWMVAASWRQRMTGDETGNEEFCGAVAVSVNGLRLLPGATASQFREGWRMMGTIFQLPPATGLSQVHTIDFDLSHEESAGTAQLEDVHVVAFQLLGGEAGFEHAQRNPPSVFMSNTLLVDVNLSALPQSPLLFASSAVREGPDNSGAQGLRVRIDQQDVQRTRDSKISEDSHFKSMFHVQQVPQLVDGDVPAGASINIFPTGVGNTVAASSLTAIDATRYFGIQAESMTGPIVINTPSPTPIVGLDLSASSGHRDRVTFITVNQQFKNVDDSPIHGILTMTTTDASVNSTFVDEIQDDRDTSEWTTAALVSADFAGEARTIDVTAQMSESGATGPDEVTLNITNAHAVSFSYPEVALTLAEIEARP